MNAGGCLTAHTRPHILTGAAGTVWLLDEHEASMQKCARAASRLGTSISGKLSPRWSALTQTPLVASVARTSLRQPHQPERPLHPMATITSHGKMLHDST
eukprot:3853939-Amphidinium_carterae.2